MKLLLMAMAAALMVGCGKAPEAVVKKEAAPAAAGPRLVEMDATGVEVAEASEGSVPLTVRANGRLTSNENTTWRVGAITDGRIVMAEAKVGDRVEKGQILARMHSHDVHESRALYRRAVAELNRMQSNGEFARRQRDRMKRLLEMKAASQEQVETSENELRNAQAAVRTAEIEVARTRQHLREFLEVPVEGAEEHAAGEPVDVHPEDLIPIRSPAKGIVLTRNVTPGAVVTASGDLYVICDLSAIWVMAAVQEEFLSKVHVGARARVKVQAYAGREFVGRVTKIDEKLDAETRTVQVRVEMDNRQGLLKPEMYAGVELEAGGSEAGVFVAQEAVQDVGGQATVFVERGRGRFEPRAVETGRSVEGRVEVKRGVAAGERVVGRGSFLVKSQMLKATLAGEE